MNYSGAVPDTFKAGAEVIVEGGMGTEGRFQAKTPATKVPFKIPEREPRLAQLAGGQCRGATGHGPLPILCCGPRLGFAPARLAPVATDAAALRCKPRTHGLNSSSVACFLVL